MILSMSVGSATMTCTSRLAEKWISSARAGSSGSATTVTQAAEKVYQRSVPTQGRTRSRTEILRFFEGFDLVKPGLVYIPQWRPDSPGDVPSDPSTFWFLTGVARKPG